jgi:hypothetical protein
MNSMAAEARYAAWMDQWRSASVELAAVHRRELSAMTDSQALQAAGALLSVVEPGEVPQHRRVSSGLVEQQAILHSRRRL